MYSATQHFIFFFSLLKFFSNFGEEQAVLPTRSCSPDTQACILCLLSSTLCFLFHELWKALNTAGVETFQMSIAITLQTLNLPEKDIWCVGWIFFLLALLIVLNIWLSRWLGMFRTESVTYWSENLSSWTWLHDQHELFYLLWGNLKY